MQQVTTRNDPAPSRLTYRLQRLMLTPLFRILLRVGVPFCVTFTVATVYLSDAGRQEAIQTAIADLRKQIETRPEFMVNELTVEGASAGVEDDIREIFPFDLPSSSFDIDLEHVRNMIVGLPAVLSAVGVRLIALVFASEPPAVVTGHLACDAEDPTANRRPGLEVGQTPVDDDENFLDGGVVTARRHAEPPDGAPDEIELLAVNLGKHRPWFTVLLASDGHILNMAGLARIRHGKRTSTAVCPLKVAWDG